MESFEVMTNFIRVTIGAVAAVALTAQAAAAQPPAAPCLAPAEIRALTTFAMPSVLNGLIANCGPQIGARSYMVSQGPSLVTAYSARKDSAWPAARKAFF